MGDPLGEGPTRPLPPTRSPRGTASARCPPAPGAHLPAAQGGGGAGSARWGRRRPPPPSRPFKAAGFRGRLGAGTAPRALRGRLPGAVSSCQAPGVSRAPFRGRPGRAPGSFRHPQGGRASRAVLGLKGPCGPSPISRSHPRRFPEPRGRPEGSAYWSPL